MGHLNVRLQKVQCLLYHRLVFIKKERPNDRPESSCLVTDGEALLVVSRLLQLVDHGHSVVLDRDVARASGRVEDEVVRSTAF